MAGIRVMVVDDHPMWREAVARDLAEAGYEVVATAGDGPQAVRIAAAARPEVVVLDLQLPDMLRGGGHCRGCWRPTRRCGCWCCRPAASSEDVLEAVKAGATGYLVKSAAREEFLTRCERTAEGDAVFTPGLAGLVLGEFRRLAAGRPAPSRTRRG